MTFMESNQAIVIDRDPDETSAEMPLAEDALAGDTAQFVPRARTPVDLPTILEGNYDRENEIARGGMGRIVAAWDRRLGRPVAIKELLRGTDELRRRFEREAIMTARLQHPGIINVYEAGRWPSGEPFYAMKRVEGESLGDVLQRTKALSERIALLPNLISMVEAMAYAHAQRVIHRDLKPANVLLGSFGETVVIDWGLAKDLSAGAEGSEGAVTDGVAADGLTVVGTIMGTPAFMPPEQARGKTVDQRADVYALGAILYHVLAGRPPYKGPTSADVLKQVLDKPPRPLSEEQAGIPQDLLTIVRKSMAREANDRYPTAKELAEDLKRFQTGQLVGAHAYTPREIVQRWLARHRAPVSIAIIAAVVLVAAGTLAVQRIARERNVAQVARREAEVKNDELTLNQARSSLRDDPTAAIAWLKNYSLDGPSWSAARMIAANARNQGVASRVLEGHEHRVSAVAYSPDGRLLASGSNDKTVRLLDLASGMSRVLKGPDWFIYSLTFSPDGKWLGTTAGAALWLWNVATGESRSFRGRFLGREIAFLPDGRSLVAVGSDEKGIYLLLWDLETGFTHTLRDPGDKATGSQLMGGGLAAAFTPDGQTLFTQTGDQTLRAWEMKTGRSRRFPNCRAFSLSKDGRLLATASAANAVVIRDLLSDRERALPAPSGLVLKLAFSPDGRWLAAASEDSLVRLWDVATGNMRALSGHSGTVGQVGFSPDGRTLASFGDDRAIRVWDVASGEGRSFRGHRDKILSVAFSPDGLTLASASADRTVRLWPTGSGDHRVLFRPETPPERWASRIVFGPQGRVLAATGDRESIHIWDLEKDTGRVLKGHGTIKPEGPTGIRSIVFSPDGKALASTSSDLTVRWWDLASASSRILPGHTKLVEHVAFSPDGTQLASVSWDTKVRLWDVTAGTSRVLSGHDFRLRSVVFSPDGRWLASSSEPMMRDQGQQDLTVRLWDATTGAGRELSGHESTVTDVQFSPDGRTIASGSMDGTVRLWDAVTGQIQRVLRGDGSIVFQVALSRDGRWLATGNQGGGLRLWNLASGQSLLLRGIQPSFSMDGTTIAGSEDSGVAWLWDTETGEGRELKDAYSNVAISPDGKLVAAIGKDGTIHLWDDDLPREPAALKALLHKLTDFTVSAGPSAQGPKTGPR